MAAGVAGLLGGNLSQGAVAGAWETFFDQQNTDAWLVYDHYGKGEFYYPEWSGLPVNDEYAYFTYAGDSALTFIADSGVGNGAFAGDYQAQRIKGVGTDVYIGNLAELEYLECVLFATGPYGQGDYHSPAFFASDFAGSGWTFVNFSFSRPWYYWTGSDWVQVDPKTLTDIVELWFSFFPKPGSTGNSEVGIDNVTLEPTVVAPPVATALVAGTPRQFRMAFTPGPGLECRVERMGVPPASGWTDVTGQTGVKGPGEHVFLTPATGTGIFRVAADPFYQMVFSP
jgi:hypothetical protein